MIVEINGIDFGCPESTQFIAKNQSGQWFAYPFEPDLEEDHWSPCNGVRARIYPLNNDWQAQIYEVDSED